MMGHYHSGANHAGYLPEGDVACSESASDALAVVGEAIERDSDYSDNPHDEWSDHTFAEAEAESLQGRSTRIDTVRGAALDSLERSGRWSTAFDTGHALPTIYWVVVADGDQESCELAEDYCESCKPE
jgi:hypothetical protein